MFELVVRLRVTYRILFSTCSAGIFGSWSPNSYFLHISVSVITKNLAKQDDQKVSLIVFLLTLWGVTAPFYYFNHPTPGGLIVFPLPSSVTRLTLNLQVNDGCAQPLEQVSLVDFLFLCL